VAFSSTFRYIDDVLSINNDQFHSYIDSIYPNELEIKDTTEPSTSASYLDVLLNIDVGGKLTTQLYDNRDDFDFVCLFCFESHEHFFSYLVTVTITSDRAAHLDLYLALTAFSSEGSYTCHTYCNTGPPFLRSYPKDP
jgi:hypothetical protein